MIDVGAVGALATLLLPWGAVRWLAPAGGGGQVCVPHQMLWEMPGGWRKIFIVSDTRNFGGMVIGGLAMNQAGLRGLARLLTARAGSGLFDQALRSAASTHRYFCPPSHWALDRAEICYQWPRRRPIAVGGARFVLGANPGEVLMPAIRTVPVIVPGNPSHWIRPARASLDDVKLLAAAMSGWVAVNFALVGLGAAPGVMTGTRFDANGLLFSWGAVTVNVAWAWVVPAFTGGVADVDNAWLRVVSFYLAAPGGFFGWWWSWEPSCWAL